MASLEWQGLTEKERNEALGFSFEFWDVLDGSQDIWAQKYGDVNERAAKWDPDEDYGLKFHTLLKYLQRSAFVVASVLRPWACDGGDNAVKPLLGDFAGWSICLDEATVEGQWQDFLNGKRNGEIEFATSASSGARGRPRLERAHAAFMEMGAVKGVSSWPQIARKLKEETGEEPNVRTLRRWREEYLQVKGGTK